jgi:hypothetical protein
MFFRFSITDKLKFVLHIKNNHVYFVKINVEKGAVLNFNQIKKEVTKQQPVIQEALEIKVSDLTRIIENVKAKTHPVAITTKPSTEELELVQLLRSNRPYNSISDVKIKYDESGVTMSWTES